MLDKPSGTALYTCVRINRCPTTAKPKHENKVVASSVLVVYLFSILTHRFASMRRVLCFACFCFDCVTVAVSAAAFARLLFSQDGRTKNNANKREFDSIGGSRYRRVPLLTSRKKNQIENSFLFSPPYADPPDSHTIKD